MDDKTGSIVAYLRSANLGEVACRTKLLDMPSREAGCHKLLHVETSYAYLVRYHDSDRQEQHSIITHLAPGGCSCWIVALPKTLPRRCDDHLRIPFLLATSSSDFEQDAMTSSLGTSRLRRGMLSIVSLQVRATQLLFSAMCIALPLCKTRPWPSWTPR